MYGTATTWAGWNLSQNGYGPQDHMVCMHVCKVVSFLTDSTQRAITTRFARFFSHYSLRSFRLSLLASSASSLTTRFGRFFPHYSRRAFLFSLLASLVSFDLFGTHVYADAGLYFCFVVCSYWFVVYAETAGAHGLEACRCLEPIYNPYKSHKPSKQKTKPIANRKQQQQTKTQIAN